MALFFRGLGSIECSWKVHACIHCQQSVTQSITLGHNNNKVELSVDRSEIVQIAFPRETHQFLLFGKVSNRPVLAPAKLIFWGHSSWQIDAIAKTPGKRSLEILCSSKVEEYSQGATYVRLICRQSNVYPNLLIAIFIITNANVNITHPKADV